MSVIKVKIVNEKISILKKDTTDPITSGNIGTVGIEFEFSEEWEGFTKTAVLYSNNYDKETASNILLNENDKIEEDNLPSELISNDCVLYIGVIGVNANNQRITTDVVGYTIKKGVPVSGVDDVVPANVFNQIVKIMMDTKQIAQSIQSAADNGEYDGYTPVKGEDYFTNQEVEEISEYAKNKVIEDLPGATHERSGVVKLATIEDIQNANITGSANANVVFNPYYYLYAAQYWTSQNIEIGASGKFPALPPRTSAVKRYVEDKIKDFVPISRKIAGKNLSEDISIYNIINALYDNTKENPLSDFDSLLNKSTLSKNISKLDSKLDTVESIAKGARQGIVYNDYAEVMYFFNSFGEDELKEGDNIYIRQLDVPDLWIAYVTDFKREYVYTSDEDFINDLKSTTEGVHVGYYYLCPLETAKVDLIDYVKKTRKIAGFALDSDITGYDLINAIKDYSPFLIGVQNALKTSYAWEAILSDKSKEFAKAVQSIGGALDSLETMNKSDYVSALNELVNILAQKADKEDWELFSTYTANGETGGFELTTVSEIKAKEVMIIGRELTFSGAANMNLGFRTSANPYSSGHRQLVFANGLTADNTYQIQGVIKRIGTDEILVSLELWREQSVATANVAKRQFVFKDTELFAGKNIVYVSNTVSSGNKINTGTIEIYTRGRY